MKSTKKLWVAFSIVVLASFLVLIYYGVDLYHKAPPVPAQVKTTDGKLLFTSQDIKDGQNVWQSIGGQAIGTVWGHGSYVAPDWTADWLHRESSYMLEKLSQQKFGASYDKITPDQQTQLQKLLQLEIRKNTYDETSEAITVTPLRAEAIAEVSKHYSGLFTNDQTLASLRNAYSIPENTIKDVDRMQKMNAFFFWASWACVTNRPGANVTYTNNWPPDEIIGNKPTNSLIIWTGFSVIVLLAGIGILAFYHATSKEESVELSELPKKDPLLGINATPSMKATLKYFWIVTILIVVQISHSGALTLGYY